MRARGSPHIVCIKIYALCLGKDSARAHTDCRDAQRLYFIPKRIAVRKCADRIAIARRNILPVEFVDILVCKTSHFPHLGDLGKLHSVQTAELHVEPDGRFACVDNLDKNALVT